MKPKDSELMQARLADVARSLASRQAAGQEISDLDIYQITAANRLIERQKEIEADGCGGETGKGKRE